MNNFHFKNKSIENKLVLLFKLLFMTIGFLQASSITFGKPIISIVQWPTVALGCFLILYRVIFFKNYINTRGIWLLVIFALGFVVSSFVTFDLGYYVNLRMFLFMVMQFGVLYAFDVKQDPEVNKKHFNISAVYYILLTALLSIISFAFMIIGYSHIFFPEAGVEGPIYYYGFVHGRLFGAYWDPNIAATMAALAVALSVYFIKTVRKKYIRVILILNILLQLLYITFSDSRTGILTLSAGIFVYALLLAAKKRMFKKFVLQSISVAVISLACVSVVYSFPKVTKQVYNDVIYKLAEMKTEDTPPQEETPEKDPEIIIPENVLDRGYETGSDISNRRFDIWGAAIDIFKTSPVFGVSRANILPYVDANLPDSYLVTNDHMRFDSMHNLVFEILASQGLVGIISFVLFAAWVVLGLLKNAKRIWQDDNFDTFAIIICIAAIVCASTLVMAEIVYVTSPISTMFWLSIGTINHFLYSRKEEEK